MWEASKRYEEYYKSGEYHHRYPKPNRGILADLTPFLSRSKRVLDFGCGNGRYVEDFLKISRGTIVAYDICSVATDIIKENFPSPRVVPVTGDRQHLTTHGPFDLVVSLFGVLSHIPFRQARVDTLHFLGSLLGGRNSRLVISVPCKVRRFRLQTIHHAVRRAFRYPWHPAVEPGDIIYSRSMDGQRNFMFYHMYMPDELKRDLQEAGLKVKNIFSESVFAESLVTRNVWVQKLDEVFRKDAPPALSYGIVAVASKGDSHAGLT